MPKSISPTLTGSKLNAVIADNLHNQTEQDTIYMYIILLHRTITTEPTEDSIEQVIHKIIFRKHGNAVIRGNNSEPAKNPILYPLGAVRTGQYITSVWLMG